MRKGALFVILVVCFGVLSMVCTINARYSIAIVPFTAMVVMYFVANKALGNKFKGFQR